jgi:hypothetical protein
MLTSQLQQQFRKLISFILLAFMLSVSIIPALGQGSIYNVNSNSCVTPPQGLVAWWPGNGNAEDIQNAHDGMTQNITYPSEYLDINRQGFAFNGRDSYVKVPGHSGLDVGTSSDGFTIELWVKPLDVDNPQPLVEWNNAQAPGDKFGLHLWLNVERWGGSVPGAIYANFFDGANAGRYIITDPHTVQLNTWQHIALTFNRSEGTAQLFYNGVSKATVTGLGQVTPLTNSAYDLYLGRRPVNETNSIFYKGRMDEVSIYNRALTENEVSAIYQARSAGKCHYTISGETTDPRGNPMSDVTVLLNSSHSLSRTRLTDESGFYSFDAAAKGNFTVMTARDTTLGEGFNPTSYTFNDLSDNQRASFQYQLSRPAEYQQER